ncbi:hypothetical protein J6590_012461 [Homalodisca vitripennis]|nr:hypothetical protein J6590_012461 [Homalodisca vitripennis]
MGYSEADFALYDRIMMSLEASSPDNAKFRLEAWKTMVQLHDRGRGVLRAIGVSNFTPKHLDQIIKATGVPPAVNQV